MSSRVGAKPPKIKLTGLYKSFPNGFVLGRTSGGTGPAELIDINSLATSISATNIIASGAKVTWPPIHEVVVSNGTNTPDGVALTDGQILIGQTSSDPAGKALSGDATLADSGALTLAAVNTDVGTYTAATVTVNAKGLVTAATANTIPVGANPTAVAGPTAIDGSATTWMRSDGAPAVQLATSGQKGLVEPDNLTITIASGIISAVQGVGFNGMLPLVTGDTPGPVFIADALGQCIGVPL